MGFYQFNGSKAHGAVRIGSHGDLADAELINLGDKVFAWDSGGGVGPGQIAVAVGVNAAAAIANLVSAINNNKPSGRPASAHIDPLDSAVCRIVSDDVGARGNILFTTTMAHPSNIIDAVGGLLKGGEDAITQTLHRNTHIVTALDVAAGSIRIPTGVQAPKHHQVDVYASTGAPKEDLTTKWATSGEFLVGDFDGATNPVQGDKVNWIVYG